MSILKTLNHLSVFQLLHGVLIKDPSLVLYSLSWLYWNSLIPATETNRLQLVLHYAVTKTPKFHHITVGPILNLSMHSLKVNGKIKCKILSQTYISLKTGQPSYSRSLHSFPSPRSTRSSSLITLIVALLLPLVLKLQTNLFIISLLFCGTVKHSPIYLIYVTLLIASLLH